MGTVEHLLAEKGYQVWYITPDQMVHEAISLMAEKDIGALPVVSNGELVGIISERDCLRKVVLQGLASSQTKVAEIMTTRVTHISPAISIEDCMLIMSRNHFRHLPVVLDNELIAMISIIDVISAVVREQKDIIGNLENNLSWGESY